MKRATRAPSEARLKAAARRWKATRQRHTHTSHDSSSITPGVSRTAISRPRTTRQPDTAHAIRPLHETSARQYNVSDWAVLQQPPEGKVPGGSCLTHKVEAVSRRQQTKVRQSTAQTLTLDIIPQRTVRTCTGSAQSTQRPAEGPSTTCTKKSPSTCSRQTLSICC